MPIGRYIAWVGTSLLVLLFVADWYFPNPFHDGPRDAIDKPIIRIASIRQPPERIVIDASEPIILAPPNAGQQHGSSRAIATAIVRLCRSASDRGRPR